MTHPAIAQALASLAERIDCDVSNCENEQEISSTVVGLFMRREAEISALKQDLKQAAKLAEMLKVAVEALEKYSYELCHGFSAREALARIAEIAEGK